MTRSTTLIARVFITLAFALEGAAVAQPTAEGLYAEGQAAYDRTDYAAAIVKWNASYELSGEHGLLFNLAQAKRLLGDCLGALTTYRRFIAADPDPASEQHKLAEDLTRELEGKCGTPPPPASIVTPAKGTPLNDREDRDERDERPGRTLKITGLVTSGAGITMLVTGIYLGHRAKTIGDQVTDACRTSCDWAEWKDKDTDGRRDATIGQVLDGIGIATIAGGAVLYYLGVRQGTVTVAPRSRDGGAAVSWSGNW